MDKSRWPTLWLLAGPLADCDSWIYDWRRGAGFVGDGACAPDRQCGSGAVESLGVGASVAQNGIRVDGISVSISDHGANFPEPSFALPAASRECSESFEPGRLLRERRLGECRYA